MGFSALTAAMTVAAAAVPNGEAPPPVSPLGTEAIAADHGADAESAAERQISTILLLAQSAPPSSESDQPTGLDESTLAPQSSEPAQTPQPQSQAPAPPARQGEIIVTGRRPSPDDPLEDLNAKSFEVAVSVDKSLVAPIAYAYEDIMPRPVRKGLRNFLRNLGEPVVFLNFMLQLKPGKAAETLGRFAINTTLGAAGVVDIAKRKPFKLPRRDNGFANTLGYYGVKPGPYFYLPLIGPTTLRDFIGSRVDLLLLPVLPTAFGKWFRKTEVVVPVWVLSELGRRIEIDDQLREIRATRDPYLAMRTYYLQKRQAEIDALHGRGTSIKKPSLPVPQSGNAAPEPTSRAPVQEPVPSDEGSSLGASACPPNPFSLLPEEAELPVSALNGSGGMEKQSPSPSVNPPVADEPFEGLSVFAPAQSSHFAGDFPDAPIGDDPECGGSQVARVARPAYTW